MSFERIFDELEISADPFALCELQGKCTLGLGGQSGATLHYLLAGKGELVLKDRPPIPIQAGTLALVPTLHPHTLRSFGAPGNPVPKCHPAELDLASHLRTGEDPEQAEKLLAICSHVDVGIRGTGGLVNLVREPIVEQVDEDAMRMPVASILAELSYPKLGSRALIRTLLLQCVIQLLRDRVLANDRAMNWMQALIDEKLWASLHVMLESPGEHHTVESLASMAGMSRSTFASRFASAYGSGPMELLRELRMHLAASLLIRSDMPVKRVAALVGFSSRSAFTRTFTQVTGTSPNQFRANA
ncbi:MAG: AraC family transcriptional regulator [Stappiaceae bacterium]